MSINSDLWGTRTVSIPFSLYSREGLRSKYKSIEMSSEVFTRQTNVLHGV